MRRYNNFSVQINVTNAAAFNSSFGIARSMDGVNWDNDEDTAQAILVNGSFFITTDWVGWSRYVRVFWTVAAGQADVVLLPYQHRGQD